MEINVRCSCGRSYRVPETAVGRMLRCKKCDARIRVTRKRRSSTPKPQPAEDEDNPLHQLFDDDDDYQDYEDYEAADTQREARRPPRIRRRREQSSDTTTRRRFKFNWAKLAAILVIPPVLLATVAAVMASPLLAVVAANVMGGISVILLLVGGVWGLCVALQEGHLLLCFFVPCYILIFIVTHIEDARGSFYCIGGGLLITAAIKLLDMWTIAQHGISVM